MKNLQVDFVLLGGARRVTLAEQISGIALANGIDASFYSVERDDGFYPISSVAKVVEGPRFGSEDFEPFLAGMMAKHDNPVLLACMDLAVHPLAKMVGKRFGESTILGPTARGARIAGDKSLTAEFCRALGIDHPRQYFNRDDIDRKVIAKPREGFGGKGITVALSADEIDPALFETHVIQDFIEGPETTHDVYVAKDGRISIGSRDRIAVVDGEVDHCVVRLPTDDERLIISKIVASHEFAGPITVQTIRGSKGLSLIEINSRLGGGVTASIAAGIPIIERLLADATGRTISERNFRPLEMKRARRDFYRFLD